MKLLSVKRSTRDKKKYMATFDNGDKIHFVHTDYKDYTTHHNKDRRENYRKRHASGKTAAPNTPNALAYHLLWGESTSLRENIKSFKSRYKM